MSCWAGSFYFCLSMINGASRDEEDIARVELQGDWFIPLRDKRRKQDHRFVIVTRLSSPNINSIINNLLYMPVSLCPLSFAHHSIYPWMINHGCILVSLLNNTINSSLVVYVRRCLYRSNNQPASTTVVKYYNRLYSEPLVHEYFWV